MTNIIVHPTHTCFDDAVEFISASIKHDKSSIHRLILIHALLLRPDNGRPYAHAWVEEGATTVWQAGIIDGTKQFYGVSRREWVDANRILHLTRYTLRQMVWENLKHRTHGPWLDRYKDHCSATPEVIERAGALPIERHR